MDAQALALEYVEPYCDIAERLRVIPPETYVRGILFRSIARALQAAHKLGSYSERFGALRYESLTLYPLAEYMLRLASAGAFLCSPQGVYMGIGQISCMNAREMTASLLGQTLIHQLAGNPRDLLAQGLAMRRQAFCYGRWELIEHDRRHLEVRYFDEYVWIVEAHTHAAAGTFESCSIKPDIVTTLSSPYSGSTHFRW